MEKLKNIKIAFIDIDGTLSNSKKEIENKTSIAIKNATDKGLLVVLCSGRNNRYVCNASKKVNASNYIISCNGGEIFNYKENKYIDSKSLNKVDVETIWNYCNNNNIGCILNCKNIRYCNNNYFVKEEDKILINDINEINEDIFQMVTFGYDYDKMNELEKLINITNSKISNPSLSYIEKDCSKHYYFFDITNNNVSKGEGITTLLNYLNLTKENAIGFGDHINDYDLFNSVGFKIAMGNANIKLKEKADFVTLTNDEYGVAHFLENYIDYGDNNE